VKGITDMKKDMEYFSHQVLVLSEAKNILTIRFTSYLSLPEGKSQHSGNHNYIENSLK
jgi:hypothetical protein